MSEPLFRISTYRGLTTRRPSWGGDNERSARGPRRASTNAVTRHRSGKGSPPLSKRPPFPASLLRPQLIKAAKQSQRPSVPRTFFSSVLPPLCLSISLIKFVWKSFCGFLSISILGDPRTPTPVTLGLLLNFTHKNFYLFRSVIVNIYVKYLYFTRC